MRCRVILATLFGLLLFSPATGAYCASTPAKNDPEAKALLEQAAAAYEALRSFSCTVTPLAGGETTLTLPRQVLICFKQPDQIAVTALNRAGQPLRIVISDGTRMFDYYSAEKEYLEWPLAPAATRHLGLVPGGFLTQVTTDPNSIADYIMRLRSVDRASFAFGTSGMVDGVQTRTIIVTVEDRFSRQTTICVVGAADHLLRSLKIFNQAGGKTSVRAETYTNVQANPDLPASTFIFVPPKGTRRIYPPKALSAPKK